MPIVDKPLDELKVYQGRNPRPDDFDAYWDRALTQMRNTDPRVERVPADFPVKFAECFDLYFTGVGEARIHARFVKPRNVDTPHPAVVLFHGYSGNAGEWTSLLPYAAAGFSAASIDCRGQGGSSDDVGGVKGNTLHGHIIRGLDDEPDKLLFRQIYLDTAELAAIIMAEDDVDETRVGCTGGSQGGGLTLACAALEPRIRRAAPTFPFLTDYKRVWEMDLAKGAYAELQDFFRKFDPRHEREDEIFRKLGYIDVQFLAPRIKADVLLSVGLMDTTCPPSTQFAAYNKISSKKSLDVYPDFGHENLPTSADRIFQFLLRL